MFVGLLGRLLERLGVEVHTEAKHRTETSWYDETTGNGQRVVHHSDNWTEDDERRARSAGEGGFPADPFSGPGPRS